ncbi:MAG: S8 family serine peptidase, partial [Thermoanaerobaculia bacterium]|nr:S8 family serine peptidase [Thermoanaerobaculia bacterium]
MRLARRGNEFSLPAVPRDMIHRTCLCLLGLLGLGTSLYAGTAPDSSRLAVGIQEDLDTKGQAEGLVLLRNRPPLPDPSSSDDLRLHRRTVVRSLRSVAATAQADLLETLDRRGVEYRPFWIVNMVWVRGTEGDFRKILSRPEVDRVLANPEIPLRRATLARVSSLEGIGAPASEVEPGVERIGAPRLWESGILGQGVTIGIADTGVDWDHPALRDAYAGWDGNTVSHDYHWWDAIHDGDGACGADSAEPCDDYNHGTHVAGTTVGDDGGPPGSRNRIGVAPGARWIACRNMDRGVGTVARYAECLQFFLAPTDSEGNDPDPDRAPEIVNNSWICEVDEGCDDPVVLREAVEAVRAAGILLVSAAGNKGPACGTLDRPPSIYSASLTVTAVDPLDRVAVSASRGPGVFPELLKPDLGAPGTSVRSAFVGGDYGRMSGTSMASPHVAGGAALLLSACPELAGDPRTQASRLRASPIFRESPQEWGGVAGSRRP